MNYTEYASFDATGLARLIRKKDITPKEVVETAITAAERIDPKINAVCQPLYDKASAALLDLPVESPLSGVPFLLKDSGADLVGTPTTNGSRLYKDDMPSANATLTDRYLNAGLVVIGKANVPEYCYSIHSGSKLFGDTLNPWNIEYSSGGSSGGSAAAVAAGITPIANADDGAGSIRIPAAICGLVGLKPSRGRTPTGPIAGEAWGSLACAHVVSRTVRDSALLLDLTHGPDAGAPYTAPPPPKAYAEALNDKPRRLRIAFWPDAPAGTVVDDDSAKAANNAAALCAHLGHELVDASLKIDHGEMIDHFHTISAVNGAAFVKNGFDALGEAPSERLVENALWGLYRDAETVSGTDYLASIRFIHQMGRRLGAFFEGVDLILTPTLAQHAWTPDDAAINDHDVKAYLHRLFGISPFTLQANMTGGPAITVPMGVGHTGVPVGAHFMAAYGQEHTLLQIAAQIESERPWATSYTSIQI